MKTHRKLFFTLLIASTTGIIHAQNVFNDPLPNRCPPGPPVPLICRPKRENATKLQKMLQFFLEKGRFPIDSLVIIGV